jgi:hypothetical protein
MAELGCLDYHHSLEVKDVFGPKEIETTGTSAELLVEAGVVVGLPGDQSNVEIARHAQTRAELLEFTPLDRYRFQACSNSIEGLRELTEPMMGSSGFGDLFGNV